MASLQALFAKGFTEAAQVQLNAGLDRAWVPNATIFEYLIRTLCESGKQEEARMVVNSMNVRMSLGTPPRALLLQGGRSAALLCKYISLAFLCVDS